MQRPISAKEFCLIVFCVIAFGYAHAANVTVNCGGKGAHSTITGALKLLHPEEPNTVTVSGTCNENFVVQSFDRLTIVTTSGASINDVSGGLDAVVAIVDSRSVTLQGFTINGGNLGVLCINASLCYLTGDTVQSSVGQQGVAVIMGLELTSRVT